MTFVAFQHFLGQFEWYWADCISTRYKSTLNCVSEQLRECKRPMMSIYTTGTKVWNLISWYVLYTTMLCANTPPQHVKCIEGRMKGEE